VVPDLTFSKDTPIYLTPFTNNGSSRLKVYNDITIPTIKLAKGLNSKYCMTVDGMQENEENHLITLTHFEKRQPVYGSSTAN
jgi:hypothetical protein